ncbi:hypothetical protein AB0F91_46315, partial [Amycolatopsis sp. NPDC023774]|uniref:hypothetical protein n=1 Tax=Amycolatopsis sp. NPDC023774 TaxID=3155015 RepID=UPI0033F9328C
DIDTLGRHLRAAWLGFIRTGTPATEPPWPRFTADSAFVRHWRTKAHTTACVGNGQDNDIR